MARLGGYVLTLTAAALVSSILLSVLKEGSAKHLLRLCCGVFLTVTAVSPLAELTSLSPELSYESFQWEGEDTAAFGAELARDARRERIREGIEAYILDKARCLGLSLQTEVILDPEDLPQTVRLWPEPEPTLRLQLEQILTSDLGIPKENLQWSG